LHTTSHYCTTPFHCTIVVQLVHPLHTMALHCTLLHTIAHYCTPLHAIALYCTLLHPTISLHHCCSHYRCALIAHYCTPLHSIAPHHTLTEMTNPFLCCRKCCGLAKTSTRLERNNNSHSETDTPQTLTDNSTRFPTVSHTLASRDFVFPYCFHSEVIHRLRTQTPKGERDSLHRTFESLIKHFRHVARFQNMCARVCSKALR
jgi:hypothetical protein